MSFDTIHVSILEFLFSIDREVDLLSCSATLVRSEIQILVKLHVSQFVFFVKKSSRVEFC